MKSISFNFKDEKLCERVDCFQKANRIKTRAEAIRQLLWSGIDNFNNDNKERDYENERSA